MMKIAAAHASKTPDAVPGLDVGVTADKVKAMTMIATMHSRESMTAASAREPTPAIVYEKTTSSGVSTSIVWESDASERTAPLPRGVSDRSVMVTEKLTPARESSNGLA